MSDSNYARKSVIDRETEGEYSIYARKSRADVEAEARGEGETLARHIDLLLDLAKRRHLNVTHIYKEVVSGETISARPEMQKLLDDVEDGKWKGVLVVEVERLARGDTIDQGAVAEAFKLSHTKIITPLKDYDPDNEYDEEYFEFGLFMSRREYKTINRRLQRGRISSVNEGKYVGNVAPYGYIKVKLEGQKGFTLAPHPEEAKVVQLIYKLYSEGEEGSDRIGVSLIARKLNALGIKPRKSETWSTASIRGILSNPVYIGKIRWNNRAEVKTRKDGVVTRSRPRASADKIVLTNGLHAPLVSDETYYKVQDIIATNPPRPIGVMRSCKNPLSGLVVCSKCGHNMVRRPYPDGYPDTLMCNTIGCSQVSAPLESVEKRLIEVIEKWASDYTVDINTSEKNNVHELQIELKENALAKLKDDKDKVASQIDNLHDLLEQGVYSIDLFLERSKKLAERSEAINSSIAELEKDLEKDKARIGNIKYILPKAAEISSIYSKLSTPKEKNDLLKEILDKVVYKKEHGARWHGSPDDFELIIFPKIPKI